MIFTWGLRVLSNNVEKDITKLLIDMGIAPNLKGFHYLRRAIGIYIAIAESDPDVLRNIYGIVSAEFNTSRTGAERSMRHAIKAGWKNRDLSLSQKLFGNILADGGDDLPSNQLFISAAGEWIRQRANETPELIRI